MGTPRAKLKKAERPIVRAELLFGGHTLPINEDQAVAVALKLGMSRAKAKEILLYQEEVLGSAGTKGMSPKDRVAAARKEVEKSYRKAKKTLPGGSQPSAPQQKNNNTGLVILVFVLLAIVIGLCVHMWW